MLVFVEGSPDQELMIHANGIDFTLWLDDAGREFEIFIRSTIDACGRLFDTSAYHLICSL
jgi:hypothetical protein